MTGDSSQITIDRVTLAQIAGDAREARDGVLKLTAIMGEQNVPEKLAQLRGEMREQHRELRSDLVNAIDRTRTEFKEADDTLRKSITDIDDRIEPLERDFERRTGGATVFRVMKDWSGLIVAIGALIVAAFELKAKIP